MASLHSTSLLTTLSLSNKQIKFSHQELMRLCVVMRRECIEKKLLNAEIPNTSEIYNSYTI